MLSRTAAPAGWWAPHPAQRPATPLATGEDALRRALHRLSEPVSVVDVTSAAVTSAAVGAELGVGVGGQALLGGEAFQGSWPMRAWVAPCRPDQLGDPRFRADHGLRYAYVTGAMANGIGSADIVEAMSRAGMLGFFGAAGLSLERVEANIRRIQANLGVLPYGVNLIHSPNEMSLEMAVADLLMRYEVRLVEASAYLGLTLPIVKYRVAGIHRGADGAVVTPNRIVAKVSRVEVASKFFAPPPERMLRELVEMGHITPEQAVLAESVPMAQDITAEADSGGHTDNRPAITLLPTLIALRDQMQARYGFAQALRVGAAGGIATPASVAAAFAMGAAYVVTGSINQACQESGSSDPVREMLAKAGQADVIMAPAADMFEMGVKVQVLKRGTMFAMRGAKLYEVYRAYKSIEEIPADVKAQLEREIFRQPMEAIWDSTAAFFQQRDPEQLHRAAADPHHKMALVFRWYLGLASRWANAGEASRAMDYQVWCGPAMGAFNEWVRGSFLEHRQERRVVTVALNLLVGAAVSMRVQSLRQQGVALSPAVAQVTPMDLEELQQCLA